MTTATKEFLSHLDQLCEERKAAIRAAADTVTVTGTTYYVSNGGDDTADGLTPETAWQTLSRVSDAELSYGDCVRFKRGDLFRGQVKTRPGVTYAAYGEGEKPRFYGWDKSLCDPALWELYDEAHRIWRLTEPILDCGTIVFNGGEGHSRKLIPSYIGGRFVCREDESRPFEMVTAMTRDLDMVCFYDERLTEIPTRGESFPIPVIDGESYGELYLRCDGGNPAEVFSEIEALPRRRIFVLACNPDVTVDNLCIKYTGDHAIAGGGQCLKGLTVTNCELGWIGGSIQHYYGTDPNYPEGGRGTVTRYGNAIEIYGGCDGYRVENCYIYQVYDAGIRTVCFISPVFPGITDIEAIFERAKDQCDLIWLENLNLRGGFKKTIMDYIAEKHPDLLPLYDEIYNKKNRSYFEALEKKAEEIAK